MDQWNNVSQKVLKTSLPKYNSMWAYVFHCVCVYMHIYAMIDSHIWLNVYMYCYAEIIQVSSLKAASIRNI